MEEDDSHSKIYEEISNGIKKYVSDVMNLFGNDYELACLKSFDEWIILSRSYITFLTKKEFLKMKQIEHTDLFSKKRKESVYKIFNS